MSTLGARENQIFPTLGAAQIHTVITTQATKENS
jgi:hypothetical protein